MDEPREVVDADRAPVDDDPLAIRHQVRLRGLTHAIARGTECSAGQREHASLAVGPGDECSTDGELRITQRAQERPRAPEAQADAEPTAFRERGQRLVIGARGGRIDLDGGDRRGECGHSRVNSSS